MDHRADVPDRFVEVGLFLEFEEHVGDLAAEVVPHRVEFLHADPFEFRLGVDLGIADQPNTLPQVVHRQQVVLPRAIELTQQQASLHLAHFGAIAPIIGVPQVIACLVKRRADQVVGKDLDLEILRRPLRQLLCVALLGSARARKGLVQHGVDVVLRRLR